MSCSGSRGSMEVPQRLLFCLNDYRVPFYLSNFVLLAFFRISYNVPSRSRLVSPEGQIKVLLLLLTPARSGRMTQI